MQRFLKKLASKIIVKRDRNFSTKEIIQKTNDLSKLDENLQKEIVEKSYKQTEEEVKNIRDSIATKPFSEISNAMNSAIKIEMRPEHRELMIENPLETNNYLQTGRNDLNTDGFSDLVIRLVNNEKANEILKSKEFSLDDPKLDIQISKESSLFISKNSNFKQFSMGNVQVMDQNSVSLEDVDVNNIPKNLNIQIFPKEKEVIVIGKEIARGSSDSVEKLDSELFVEKSLEDIRNEELNLVERILIISNPLNLFFWLIKYFPLLLFITFYLQAKLEYSRCVSKILEIDEQNMKALKTLKESRGKKG